MLTVNGIEPFVYLEIIRASATRTKENCADSYLVILNRTNSRFEGLTKISITSENLFWIKSFTFNLIDQKNQIEEEIYYVLLFLIYLD